MWYPLHILTTARLLEYRNPILIVREFLNEVGFCRVMNCLKQLLHPWEMASEMIDEDIITYKASPTQKRNILCTCIFIDLFILKQDSISPNMGKSPQKTASPHPGDSTMPGPRPINIGVFVSRHGLRKATISVRSARDIYRQRAFCFRCFFDSR